MVLVNERWGHRGEAKLPLSGSGLLILGCLPHWTSIIPMSQDKASSHKALKHQEFPWKHNFLNNFIRQMKCCDFMCRKILGYLSVCAHIKPHSKVITHFIKRPTDLQGHTNPPGKLIQVSWQTENKNRDVYMVMMKVESMLHTVLRRIHPIMTVIQTICLFFRDLDNTR